jgi:hypothetical protein
MARRKRLCGRYRRTRSAKQQRHVLVDQNGEVMLRVTIEPKGKAVIFEVPPNVELVIEPQGQSLTPPAPLP